jgi:hypothetical protein
MATSAEIYRTAGLLVQVYGEMAPIGATLRADHLHNAGDRLGSAVWRRIAKAADDLLKPTRPDGVAIH